MFRGGTRLRPVVLAPMCLLVGCRLHFDPLEGDATNAGRFCEGVVPPAGFETLFCRDFDDGTDALAGWDLVGVTPPASVAAESIEVATPPGALVTRLEDNPANCSYARVRVRLPQALVRSRVLFDLRLGGVDTDLAAVISYLNVRIPQTLMTGIGCQLLPSNQGAAGGLLYEQVSPTIAQFHPMTVSPPDQIWVRFEIDVDWADRGVDILIDGVYALPSRLILRPDCIDAANGPMEVYFGQHCQTGGGPREVRFDNMVVFGIRP